ncbi:PREDICTED: uncharacterized protein LOC101299878 [Fragaria vesca subsp. vesca]|uniref:uncharacterized protein LOC101299878 n=1 Tax=Fragaria vesca subsp. vesca TaxID=101020 RepID=UPI0002C31584|nr:PREDICTED: uncharacterized protein LOC101299878 [Fragaria vesca subsp. vesca]
MSGVDLERGGAAQTHRLSFSRSDVSGDGSVCFSDADDGSCYSQFFSTNGGSYDEYNFAAFVSDPAEAGVVGVTSSSSSSEESRRDSSVSECSVHVVEIEVGAPEIKVHLDRVERDCRICHLGLESNSHESGAPIDLGCSCKDDLGSAHRNCADAWFKIKGNKICEICHSIARNIVGPNDIEMIEQLNNEAASASATAAVSAPGPSTETRSFWHGHRFLNFLLACMVFAFVISWLFHFNVPS